MASVTPPSSYVPPAQAAGSSPPPDGERVDVPVRSLPPSLKDVPRDVNLRGTVQGQNPDGTTRISTPRGPVDVQLPPPLPARGAEVNVDIPAGSPPRTATVTLPAPAPLPQTPLPQTPLPQTPVPAPGTVPPQGQTPGMPPAGGQAQQPPVSPMPAPAQPGLPPAGQLPSAGAVSAGLPAIPVPIDAPAPSTQQALPSGILLLQQAAEATHPKGMTPQNLLGFLKTSLQEFLKTPALPRQATGNTLGVGTDQPSLAGTAQRPLQIGQMLRLTPLPVGQPMMPAPGAPLAAQNAAPVPALTIPGMPQAQIVPGAPLTASGIPAVQMPASGAGLPDLMRALLPAQMILQPVGTTPGTAQPGLQMMSLGGQPGAPAPLAALPQSVAPGAQQFIIATAGDHAPHLIAPHALDVRVGAILPNVTPPQVLHNQGLANLLHGAPPSPVLFASVSGQTAQGLPVVELPTFTIAPDGTPRPAGMPMVLQFPARGLAHATVIRFDILSGMPAGTPVSSAPGLSFAGLDDLLQGMTLDTQGAGASHLNPLQMALPKPGPAAFTAPVLMFVAALRGGDITAWMGDKGIELVRGSKRADALARLSGDFAASVRAFREEEARPPGEWRSLNLPMLYGGEISRLQMHYRSFDQNGEGGGEKGKTSGTRFVMDVSLTRMGDMQIDGFSLGKKMDVTLRSEQALSAAMREVMRKRYFDAISGIGFSGELNFSADATRKGWVDIDDHRGEKAAALA